MPGSSNRPFGYVPAHCTPPPWTLISLQWPNVMSQTSNSAGAVPAAEIAGARAVSQTVSSRVNCQHFANILVGAGRHQAPPSGLTGLRRTRQLSLSATRGHASAATTMGSQTTVSVQGWRIFAPARFCSTKTGSLWRVVIGASTPIGYSPAQALSGSANSSPQSNGNTFRDNRSFVC